MDETLKRLETQGMDIILSKPTEQELLKALELKFPDIHKQIMQLDYIREIRLHRDIEGDDYIKVYNDDAFPVVYFNLSHMLD